MKTTPTSLKAEGNAHHAAGAHDLAVELTERTGMADRVSHVHASALEAGLWAKHHRRLLTLGHLGRLRQLCQPHIDRGAHR